MIANLSHPVAALCGTLDKNSLYYARMLNGRCIIQRKPNRKGHIKTANEDANQKLFTQLYRGKKRTSKKADKEYCQLGDHTRDHTITAKAPPNAPHITDNKSPPNQRQITNKTPAPLAKAPRVRSPPGKHRPRLQRVRAGLPRLSTFDFRLSHLAYLYLSQISQIKTRYRSM